MTRKGLNPTNKRKSYLYFVFALAERKNELQKKVKYRIDSPFSACYSVSRCAIYHKAIQ